MRRIDLMAWFVILAGTLISLHGCGGAGSLSTCPGGPDCACTDSKSCSCTAEKGCAFDCQTEGCKLECGTNGTCEGACSKDCNVSCPEGSECTIDLGPNSDFNCTKADCYITAGDEADVNCSGGTCEITCSSSCQVTCSGEAVCTIKCSGDSDFKPVDGTAKCGG